MWCAIILLNFDFNLFKNHEILVEFKKIIYFLRKSKNQEF